MLLTVFLQAPQAFGQQSWEYSPYRLRVWVAVDPSPRLSQRTYQEIEDTLKRRGAIIGKSAWDVQPSPAPVAVAGDTHCQATLP